MSATIAGLHATAQEPAEFTTPTGREEEWRFTPLRRLRGLHSDAVLGSAGVTVTVDAAPEIFSERTRHPHDGDFVPADRVSARAFAAVTEATVITVPKETTASAPTYIRVTGVDAGTATAAHLVIDVQPYGRAVVVIDQRGSATYADNAEIRVADGGDLTVVSIADWDDDTVQVSRHQATLGRDAHLKHVAVTLGGSLVRLSPTVRYAGPGGDAELFGITFATASSSTGGQHLEHRLFVDHDVPNCRSRVRYKSALRGDGAHTVWIGDVLIRPEATGTDTYEYNRNLVLTDGARADSVPNLEILTGEVIGAGHASANGRLEDEHLFYLQARGIPLDEARRLVIRGFFGELIATIGVPELEERIAEAIEAELA
ncbi:MAG TPA: Fe-S cluster assembly protein SufD [Trebonia sp.]|nr:Fe-S cluster assembly protein SufD [Trebonia sp.]